MSNQTIHIRYDQSDFGALRVQNFCLEVLVGVVIVSKF